MILSSLNYSRVLWGLIEPRLFRSKRLLRINFFKFFNKWQITCLGGEHCPVCQWGGASTPTICWEVPVDMGMIYFLNSFIGKNLHQKVLTKRYVVNTTFRLGLFFYRPKIPVYLSNSEENPLFNAFLMIKTTHLNAQHSSLIANNRRGYHSNPLLR